MRRVIIILLSFLGIMTFSSCEKFLSERPSSSVANLSSLTQMQALMDAGNRMNFGNYSWLLEVGTDDFFLGKGGFDGARELEKSVYTWDDRPIYTLEFEPSNWTNPFHIIAVANTVLDELPLIKESGGLSREHIEGTALFHRAFAYHNLVQVYCKAYDPSTADIDLGLPIRFNSDMDQKSIRASLKETFLFIESDIKQAIELLPIHSEFKTRPSKVAAHALMARIYLLMGKYFEANEHVQQSLSMYDHLIDFNELDVSRPYPIVAMNEETLFFAYFSPRLLLPSRECYVDTILYEQYQPNDLRKTIFFRSENNGYHSFRGSFMGSTSCFIGLTVSELLLIQAESLARLGQTQESLAVLNKLLKNRYKFDEFESLTLDKNTNILHLVLEERRKELIFRGNRWSDLKRLNNDPQFAKTLIRRIPGYQETYELPPGDLRYVYLIPETVIEISGLIQNPR